VTLDLRQREVIPSSSTAIDATDRITLREIAAGSNSLVSVDSVTANGISTATPATVATGRFYIATTELTRAQWISLVAASGAAVDTTPWTNADTAADVATLGGDNRSASGLSHDAITTVLHAWNARSPHRLRLPTGNEWEAACRASSPATWSWGGSTTPATTANYALTLESAAAPGPGFAADRLANAWGLRDMHGNTWEWVSDGGESNLPCLRGGSWSDRLVSARSGNRFNMPTFVAYPLAGVRLVLEPQ